MQIEMTDELCTAIVERAAEMILEQSGDVSELAQQMVEERIDTIFDGVVKSELEQAVKQAVSEGFEREYRPIDSFGKPCGDATTINRELSRLVGGYWTQRVDKGTGKPTDSAYNGVSRAEYHMMQICGNALSEQMMKQDMVNVCARIKDTFRGEYYTHVDSILDAVFHVRSNKDKRQEQGKEPWPKTD